MEHKSLVGWASSGLITITGMITLNQLAIIVGILTGLSTIALNIYTYITKRKERKSK